MYTYIIVNLTILSKEFELYKKAIINDGLKCLVIYKSKLCMYNGKEGIC